MDPRGWFVCDRQQSDHSIKVFDVIVFAIGICRTAKY